jgi:hypothetical protein
MPATASSTFLPSALSFHREESAVVIRQPDTFFTELTPQDSVFGLLEIDDRLLPLVDPAGEDT